MFNFSKEKEVKQKDEKKALSVSNKSLTELQENFYKLQNKINLINQEIDAQKEKIEKLYLSADEDKTKKNLKKLEDEKKQYEQMVSKLNKYRVKAISKEGKIFDRRVFIEQKIKEIQNELLNSQLSQKNLNKLEKEKDKYIDEIDKWANAEKNLYAEKQKAEAQKNKDYLKERIVKQQRLFKEDFKLLKVLLNKINDNLEFSSKTAEKDAPSMFKIGKKLIDKELALSIFNNLEISDFKIIPKLQNDAQILIDFFTNSNREYNPEMPPFFLWLLEDQANSFLENRDNAPLIKFLSEHKSEIRSAVEKILTQIVIPKFLENGNKKNINKLAKEELQYREELINLELMQENLERLKKEPNKSAVQTKEIEKLEKKVNKLISLQDDYQFAMLIKKVKENGVDHEFLNSNLVPIVSELIYNVLSQPDEIAKIAIELVKMLKTNDTEQRQKYLENILEIIKPKDLFTDQLSSKINELFTNHSETLGKVITVLLYKSDPTQNSDLIKELNLAPEFTAEVLQLFFKMFGHLQLNGNQLQNIYSDVKKILVYNYNFPLKDAQSIEEISVIGSVKSGKTLSLLGTFLQEITSSTSGLSNFGEIYLKLFTNPEFKAGFSNIIERFMPDFINSSEVNSLNESEEIATQFSLREPGKKEELAQKIYDTILPAQVKLFKGLKPEFYPKLLLPMLEFLGEFFWQTNGKERDLIYSNFSKILKNVEIASDLAQIKFILITDGSKSKKLHLLDNSLNQIISILTEDKNRLHKIKEKFLALNTQKNDKILQKKHEREIHIIEQKINNLELALDIPDQKNLSAEKLEQISSILNEKIAYQFTNFIKMNFVNKLLQRDTFLTSIRNDVIPKLMNSTNAPAFAHIAKNIILNMPGLAGKINEKKISVGKLINILEDKSEQNIINISMKTISEFLKQNLEILIKLYILYEDKQQFKEGMEVKNIIFFQYMQKELINQTLEILADVNNPLFNNVNSLAAAIYKEKDFWIPFVINILENNETFASLVNKKVINLDSVNQLVNFAFLFITKITEKQENIINFAKQLKVASNNQFSEAAINQFINDLDKDVGYKIHLNNSPEVNAIIKNELNIIVSKLSPDTTLEEFIISIESFLTTVPEEWQKGFTIECNAFDIVKFYEIFIKLKITEGQGFIKSGSNLLHSLQFIPENLIASLPENFSELLNTQLQLIEDKSLKSILKNVDNPGEITKDSMIILTKFVKDLSEDLASDAQSPIINFLNTLCKVAIISQKINHVNEKPDLYLDTGLANFRKILKNDKNRAIYELIDQVPKLINTPLFKELLEKKLPELFNKHPSLDNLLNNFIVNKGWVNTVNIKNDKLIKILNKNSETIAAFAKAYLNKNYVGMFKNSIKLLIDPNVISILWSVVEGLFRFKNVKYDKEINHNLKKILSERTALSEGDNVVGGIVRTTNTSISEEQNLPSTSQRKESLSSFLDLSIRELEKEKNPSKTDKQLLKTMKDRDFSGRLLDDYSLSNYVIDRFNFSKAKFSSIDFENVTLSNTSFKDAKFLDKISFKGSIIDAATLKTLLPSIKKFNKDKPTSEHITLNDVKIVGDISKLSFRNISLQRADFSEIQKPKTDEHKADVKYTDLTGAKFDQELLPEKIFTNIEKAKFDKEKTPIDSDLQTELQLINKTLQQATSSLGKLKNKTIPSSKETTSKGYDRNP